MVLRYLNLHQFRNYESLHREFPGALNVLLGPNAQGKSNLLEAIYLLATTKSMRGATDDELIRWDSPAAVVRAEVLREKANDVEVELALSRTHKKKLVVNTVGVSRASDFVGQLKCVSFSVSDLEVVHGEPSRRRRFLDLEISQISPSYCHALGYYRRIVEQRNRLLKMSRDRSMRSSLEETLGAWTEQLVQYGSKLVDRRREFLERLQEAAAPIHEELTEGREQLKIAYQPSFRFQHAPTLEEAFRDALREVHQEELRRQVTLLGPHRDEVQFLVSGRDMRTYGSQGQQRTVALSTKLGELAMVRELTGEPPICLLDDVFSELDSMRRRRLMQAVLDECQTFLTTTDMELLPPEVRARAQVHQVREGEVGAEGSGA